jgi:hypothetical protein
MLIVMVTSVFQTAAGRMIFTRKVKEDILPGSEQQLARCARGEYGMDNNLRVVVAAAGTGRRMESKVNKQYILLNDRPVLCYSSLDLFEAYDPIERNSDCTKPSKSTIVRKKSSAKYNYKKVSGVIAGGENDRIQSRRD